MGAIETVAIETGAPATAAIETGTVATLAVTARNVPAATAAFTCETQSRIVGVCLKHL
jgi:hypothetical protein